MLNSKCHSKLITTSVLYSSNSFISKLNAALVNRILMKDLDLGVKGMVRDKEGVGIQAIVRSRKSYKMPSH